MHVTIVARLLAAAAALMGAAGVGASAMASHGGYGDNLKTAAEFALLHGGLIAALCLVRQPPLATVAAAAVMLAGSLLFCGDLALRAVTGQAMFPMAAPAGGMLLMGGWALLAISALLQLRLLPR
jgi:uncharacterized membrane protein YgdD (TMEM256/DUF423 family)